MHDYINKYNRRNWNNFNLLSTFFGTNFDTKQLPVYLQAKYMHSGCELQGTNTSFLHLWLMLAIFAILDLHLLIFYSTSFLWIMLSFSLFIRNIVSLSFLLHYNFRLYNFQCSFKNIRENSRKYLNSPAKSSTNTGFTVYNRFKLTKPWKYSAPAVVLMR